MNKELYLQKEELKQKKRKKWYDVIDLNIFLTNNAKNFKRKESLEALKNIKDYLLAKEKEYQELEKSYYEFEEEFESTCFHEVAIKYSNTSEYCCLICERSLGCDVPSTSIISIDTTKDYKVANILKEIFDNITHSDSDLVETISNAVEEMQYEREIKVYRRQI